MIIRTPREIGALIRARRRDHRLTQEGLAELVGASRKWIIDIEAGKRTSDLGMVLQTLNALGLDLDIRERRSPAPARATNIDAIVTGATQRTPVA